MNIQVIAASFVAFQARVAWHVQGGGGREDLPPGLQRELDEVILECGLWVVLIYAMTHASALTLNQSHTCPFVDQVMALVSHRADAPPELWAEVLAIAKGLCTPEKAKAPPSKGEEEEEGEGEGEDSMVVRSDALFGSWDPERLAVGALCLVCIAIYVLRGLCRLIDKLTT